MEYASMGFRMMHHLDSFATFSLYRVRKDPVKKDMDMAFVGRTVCRQGCTSKHVQVVE